MKSQMRNKAGLLSRASTLAILAAAGALGAAQQAKAECDTTWDVPTDGTTINANRTCVVVTAPVTGDVVNQALIGDPGAPDVPFDVFNDIDGRLINNGNIFGGFFDGKFTQRGALTIRSGATITGGIVNNLAITSTTGNGIQIGTGGESAGFIEGGILNTDDISSGARYGIAALEGSLSGGLTNETNATISGGLAGVFIADTFGTWSGGISNSGQISGVGAAIQLGDGAESGSSIVFEDGITNNSGGIIDSSAGPAILITNDVTTFTGGIDNYGGIEGATNAIVIQADSFQGGIYNDALASIVALSGDAIYAGTNWSNGNFDNRGTISGAQNGFNFFAGKGSSFAGDVLNSGQITGDDTGIVMVLDTFNGNVTNSGRITGTNGTGLSLSATNIAGPGGETPAEITNTGLIEGGVTGAFIGASTFIGNITNDGTINGGAGEILVLFDPGLWISVATYTGNITNNGTLSANSNALFVDVANLTGAITNTGLIEATDPGQTAVLLEIGNGATFTNTAGGLVLGDIVFGGKAPYDFAAEDGGVEGQIFGEMDFGEGFFNDDTITVQNGTHYFYFAGKGAGITDFASFTVENGGTAVMGARFEGDPNGSGYSFANVDNVNVNNGGVLYIDKGATLAVDNNYTQQDGGTLVFYLAAPGGAGFSDLTGTVVAGSGDYGQILVSGTATLDGTIAGFLDPAFASANSGLTTVEYNDVIIADGGIVGDFSTLALIANNSLFELNELIDGNTVDLRVTRTSVGHIGSLPGIVVETAGPWKAMVNDRSNGIGSGSCGLAGDGWCFNRFAQAEGAGQVMTDATPGEDPFAWLRTGVRRVGETAAWGRLVGVWGETDGDAGSLGTDFDIYGGIVGIDHVFTPTLLAGVAAQWTTSEIEFNGLPDNADVDSLEVGAYVSLGDTRLYLNANTSFIWHDFEVNRFGAGGPAFGDYDGTTISAYAEGGKIFETERGFRIQPLVAVSYAHLETDAYSETGTAVTLLNVFDSDFDTLKSNIGARFAYPIPLQSGRRLVPEARVVWAHEFLDDQSSFLATIQGGPPVPSLIVGEEFSRDTMVVGTGVTAPISEATTLFVDYDAGLNADITTHTVSAGFRTRW